MRTIAQVGISPETTLAGVKIAKEAVKAIKKSADGGDSALVCMELETEITYQVTTIGDDHVPYMRACELKRITPLNIKVSVQYTTQLEISWIAEGVLDGKNCLAKISAYATWDGWYVWDNGVPKAPYAEVFIRED